MIKPGRLFVISAPSGAGKTTLCEKLLNELPDIVRSVSLTTRKIRKGEIRGKDYYFTSVEAFKKKIKNKEFLEYARVFGNYYGSPRKFVEKNIQKNKDVILNIDVQGAMQIKKTFKHNSTFIFILPPTLKDLKKRLLKRKTDTKKQIQARLDVAKNELKYLKYYDFQIVNDDIKTAFKQLKSIVIAMRAKV
ncbi:MAG: guanylate kinase [Candidatus Omnitrophota bacterium]